MRVGMRGVVFQEIVESFIGYMVLIYIREERMIGREVGFRGDD